MELKASDQGKPNRQIQDDVLGSVRKVFPGVFTFRVKTADGAVRGRLRLSEGQAPSPAQLGLMRWAVAHAWEVKRLAVAFVRRGVLTQPDCYGLLEEDGRPAEWAAPLLHDERGTVVRRLSPEFLELEGDRPGHVRVHYATELDTEHGVPVWFYEGRPVEAFA